MNDRLTALDRAVAELHAGQTDQQGQPYIDHLRAVAAAVSDPAKPVAYFHDSLEDRKAGRAELIQWLTHDEIAAVLLLTRRERQTYAEYIERIASTPGRAGELAREVKLADLHHNLGRLTPALERLRPRYEHALAVLG